MQSVLEFGGVKEKMTPANVIKIEPTVHKLNRLFNGSRSDLLDPAVGSGFHDTGYDH
ncbi:hypothetical protein ACLOJK_035353 [Asimina triloba]